ncbi:MAG: CGNR zinc finger domain-containing protein [Actinomycetota bacterium]
MTANLEAPADVALVRSFVNTIEVESGADQLTTAKGLAEWLSEAGLAEPGARPSARDLQLARRLRTALRAAIEGHGPPDSSALRELDVVFAELPLRAVSAPEGLAACDGGVRGGLAQIAAAVTTARITGTWDRLKICPAGDCLWAFYDASRNHSKRWCSMDVCGNRSKVRAFRDRAR